MSDAIPLPPRPNLEQYKKLARDLQAACKSTDPDVIRQWAERWMYTLARRHGPDNGPTAEAHAVGAEKIERRWNKLQNDTEQLTRCTLAGAQFFIAREHGFTSWPKFSRHVQELTRANSPVSAFESAVDAIVNGDVSTLRQLLADHPGLVQERSTREHRSTLLHYVSANGVEDFRQKTPKNIVEITNLLLDAGADIEATSEAYGGGSTTLGLVATSVHPEKAGVQIALLQTLLDRGADLQSRGAGNHHTIVHGCIANGQPSAARFLAEHGAPLDAEGAAVVGRLDVLQAFFDEHGVRRPEIDPKQLESAFLYACGYGSLEAARFLLDYGVSPAARDKDGRSALHWASWAPEIECIKLLLEHGAPVDTKDDRFHATPLDTVLWTWNRASNEAERERCYQAIALLARAGAELDRDQWREPGKDSSAMLEKIDADSRMQAALQGVG